MAKKKCKAATQPEVTATTRTSDGKVATLTKNELDALRAAPADAVEVIRLAAECWRDCPWSRSTDLVEDIRDEARRILFVYRSKTPGMAAIGKFTSTERNEKRTEAAATIENWTKGKLFTCEKYQKQRDALAIWGDDLRSGPRRLEWAALILMALDINAKGKVSKKPRRKQNVQRDQWIRTQTGTDPQIAKWLKDKIAHPNSDCDKWKPLSPQSINRIRK